MSPKCSFQTTNIKKKNTPDITPSSKVARAFSQTANKGNKGQKRKKRKGKATKTMLNISTDPIISFV
jgi:hypothetical protein|tara:strand:- start:429 stop:629 length:201 start_codon:yes stop_codon:yes gene_type:complete